jgi:hypothetical protein
MEIKTNYYHGPLDNPSHGQPWCCRPLHHSLSARSSYWIDFIVLSLTAVRATIERREWRMDCRRSQKVISGQGDTSPSQETCLYLRDISAIRQCKKAIKKRNLQPDPGWVPLNSPLCSLSLLFSTNKIIPKVSSLYQYRDLGKSWSRELKE